MNPNQNNLTDIKQKEKPGGFLIYEEYQLSKKRSYNPFFILEFTPEDLIEIENYAKRYYKYKCKLIFSKIINKTSFVNLYIYHEDDKQKVWDYYLKYTYVKLQNNLTSCDYHTPIEDNDISSNYPKKEKYFIFNNSRDFLEVRTFSPIIHPSIINPGYKNLGFYYPKVKEYSLEIKIVFAKYEQLDEMESDYNYLNFLAENFVGYIENKFCLEHE